MRYGWHSVATVVWYTEEGGGRTNIMLMVVVVHTKQVLYYPENYETRWALEEVMGNILLLYNNPHFG